MKGFTISGPDGPIVSVSHKHGELFSKVAAAGKVLLPATEKCTVCGYRKVEHSKLATFFAEIGNRLSSGSAKDAVATVLEALECTKHSGLELVDDYTWCEKHAYF